MKHSGNSSTNGVSCTTPPGGHVGKHMGMTPDVRADSIGLHVQSEHKKVRPAGAGGRVNKAPKKKFRVNRPGKVGAPTGIYD